MAAHSSFLAWTIPWTVEPSRLQFTGSQRVGHDCSNYCPTHSLPRMKFRCDSNSSKYGEKQVTGNLCIAFGASLVAQTVKDTCNVGDLRSVPRLGRSGEGMATHSSILAWRVPRTEDCKESDMTE